MRGTHAAEGTDASVLGCNKSLATVEWTVSLAQTASCSPSIPTTPSRSSQSPRYRTTGTPDAAASHRLVVGGAYTMRFASLSRLLSGCPETVNHGGSPLDRGQNLLTGKSGGPFTHHCRGTVVPSRTGWGNASTSSCSSNTLWSADSGSATRMRRE